MLTVTKKFDFCYGHSLPDYNGKCRNQHGHNSTLEIEIGSKHPLPVDYDGMIIDFGNIKTIVNREIIDALDHRYLNDIIRVPTAENIVRWIVEILSGIFKDGLIRVRLYETNDSYAEWKK